MHHTTSGECIEFISQPFDQVEYPQNSISWDQNCKSLVNEEIFALKDKGVIVPCTHEPGELISLIFTVPENDGTVRLILNLKKLNSLKRIPISKWTRYVPS